MVSEDNRYKFESKECKHDSFINVFGKWSLQVGVFNMGSTVVLVFQAPTANSPDGSSSSSDYRFCVKQGERVRVGQALGRWKEG